MLNYLAFEVTQEDIEKGKRGSALHCAAARSIRRTLRAAKALPKGALIEVGAERVAIQVGGLSPFRMSSFATSKTLAKFIRLFDGKDGKRAAPASFRLKRIETIYPSAL